LLLDLAEAVFLAETAGDGLVHDLIGTRFAGYGVHRAAHHRPGGARQRRSISRRAHHAVNDPLPGVGTDVGQIAFVHRLEPFDLPRVGTAQARHQPRPPDAPARGEDAGVVSQLQGCDEKVALTDAEVHRLARKPYFVGGIGEMRFLPGTRRHEARLLAADVDPGWPAEAEERQPGGDPVDTHLVRDAVEIDVAGSGDREV